MVKKEKKKHEVLQAIFYRTVKKKVIEYYDLSSLTRIIENLIVFFCFLSTYKVIKFEI